MNKKKELIDISKQVKIAVYVTYQNLLTFKDQNIDLFRVANLWKYLNYIGTYWWNEWQYYFANISSTKAQIFSKFKLKIMT